MSRNIILQGLCLAILSSCTTRSLESDDPVSDCAQLYAGEMALCECRGVGNDPVDCNRIITLYVNGRVCASDATCDVTNACKDAVGVRDVEQFRTQCIPGMRSARCEGTQPPGGVHWTLPDSCSDQIQF